jgi:crossover junction endodeoxyribonuclease RuvC
VRIVALDPSLTATGVADSDRGPYLIVPPPGVTGEARNWQILKAVIQAVHGADVVLVEGYAFGAKGRAVFEIAELGGVLRLGFYTRGVRWVEVPPSCVKTLATGKGNSKKDAVLAEAIRRLGYAGSDHNEADALWVLQGALIHYGLPGAATLPQTHLRGLDKIQWPAALLGAA